MRAARWLVVVLGIVAGCAGDDEAAGDTSAVRFLTEPSFRRQRLVDELVNPANGYSTLRLQHYASGADGDWDRLPAWNPPVSAVRVGELDDPTLPPAPARALPVDDETRLPLGDELRAIGEVAFFGFPAQLLSLPPSALTRTAADRYGLWLDQVRGVGGLVRVQLDDGTEVLSLTCSSCHADTHAGALVAGLPSGRFDLGRLLVDEGGVSDTTTLGNFLAWGPGRVDVTTGDGSIPERISDLRPVRGLSHLQYDATVRQQDIVSLAIRLDTLMITGHGQTVRAPRVVALALARYLWSLADDLPPAPAPGEGATLFATHCAACHAGPDRTGPPQPLETVGTDPACGLSPDRGTGFYRVPSLRGVAARPTLFHDGSARDLASLLDPARVGADYTDGARGPGPIPGHLFGLDLSPDQRAALLAFLRAL